MKRNAIRKTPKKKPGRPRILKGDLTQSRCITLPTRTWAKLSKRGSNMSQTIRTIIDQVIAKSNTQ